MTSERGSLPQTGIQLRDWLASQFPDFALSHGEWQYEPDGSLTPHHVSAEFSHHYRNRAADFSEAVVYELFRSIEVICAADPSDRDLVANALCTCFLESIAYSEVGEASRKYMGPISRHFFDYWHEGYTQDSSDA